MNKERRDEIVALIIKAADGHSLKPALLEAAGEIGQLGKPQARADIDKDILVTCVAEAEGGKPLTKKSDLWTKTAALYLQKAKKPLKAIEVSNAVKALGIPHLTVSAKGPGSGFGREKIEVDMDLLVRCIAKVEANGPLSNGRAKLCQAVAQEYNSQVGEDGTRITAAIVYLRIKDNGIAIKTPPGKRGGAGKGRKGIEVDLPFLGQCITSVEGDSRLSGRSELYELVAERYNKTKPIKITKSVVMTRLLKHPELMSLVKTQANPYTRKQITREKKPKIVIPSVPDVLPSELWD